jgi:hypothetical protein
MVASSLRYTMSIVRRRQSWDRSFAYMTEQRNLLATTSLTNDGGRNMRKVIMALVISAAFIVSGISATAFSTGQLTGSVWAEAGGE